MRSVRRRLIPFLSLLAVALTAITCTDAPIAPGPTSAARPVALSLSPVFSNGANQAGVLYDDAGLHLDHLRIVITRTPADTLKDTTVALVTGQSELQLDFRVQAVPGEQLTGEVQFFAGTNLLFAGSGPVIVRAAGQPVGQPSVITVTAVGPGATAASVTVTPASGSYPTTAPVTLAAHAFAADKTEIPNAIFAWSVSDTTVATVSAAGVVQPTAKAGTVQVTATTVNGTSGSATLTFVPPAAGVVVVSGSGQTGPAGSALPSPLVVEVQTATGGPVAGQTVIFGASGGASVTPSSVVTDDAGQAKATLTLGPTAGTYGFVATTGNFSVTATETASAPASASLAFQVGPSSVVAGSIVSPAVTVRALDASGNLASSFTGNVTVALAANPGQATLGGTLTRAAVGGVATFNDLTVSAAGTGYTLQATSSGLTTATSAAFNVTAASSLRTWTGAVSTDWNVAGNWNGGVPGAGNSVQIPAGTPNSPALTSNVAAVTDVTVASGATLSLGGNYINASGNVSGGSGPGITGSGFVTMAGTAAALSGAVSTVYVTGNTTISAATSISVGLSVSAGGSLSFGPEATLNTALLEVVGGRVTVGTGTTVTAGLLTVNGTGGVLSQTGGAITVTGQAIFDGDNTTGLLTGGTLTLGGSFVQGQGTTTPTSFVASGTHKVILTGTTSHTLYFANPTTSHFENVEIDGPGSVVLSTNVAAAGQLISPSGASPITSNGSTLSVAGLDVDGMTFDNTYLVSTGGTIAHFDNVTFQDYAATLTPLTIVHPGAATAFTFNNTQFLVTPTTGDYISATDNSPNDGQVLTISFVNSTPVDGQSHTATAGGAVVEWPVITGGVNSWTNAAGGSWSTASNWSLNRVPVTGDSVVIALPGTYIVTLDTTFTASAITVGAAGSSGIQTLALSGRTLTVGSALRINATGAFAALNGVIAGAGTVINQGALGLKTSTVNTSVVNQGTLIANDNNSIAGAVTAAGGSTIRVESDGGANLATLTVASGFTNHGTVELTSTSDVFGSELAVTNGTLTNASDGAINALPGTGGARTLAALFNNQGTIAASAPLTLATTSGTSTNSGTISATNADLTLSQSGTAALTSNGVITIGGGQTGTISGGAFTLGDGTLNGGGAVVVNNATAAFDNSFTLSALTVNNSNVNFESNVSTDGLALTFSHATVGGSATITNVVDHTMTTSFSTFGTGITLANQGVLNANDANTISGTLTTSQGSAIEVQSDAASAATLTVASSDGFSNNGLIELTSTAGTHNSTLAVSGTLTNGEGGTINSLAGTGGTRTIVGTVQNSGTINVVPGAAGLLTIQGNLSTSGSINLELGGLTAGTGYDRLAITGAATLSGTLNVSLINGFTPTFGNPFTLLTYGSVSGDFGAITYPGDPADWSAQRTSNSYTVTYSGQ